MSSTHRPTSLRYSSLRRRPRSAWLACAVICLLVSLSACWRPAPPPVGVLRTEALRPPFDIAERRALFGQDMGHFGCPKPAPVVQDVLVDDFYADKDASVVNPETLKRYQDAVKPITVYEIQVTTFSDTFVRSRPAIPAAARCVLDWLDAWASKDGLLGQVNQQGRHERKWALGAIAWSYLKVRDEQGLDPATRLRTEGWIRRLAAPVMGDYGGRAGTDTRNNDAYWAAASVLAAGLAVNDRTLFGWGVERYRAALAQIQSDGTLPLELLRKSKAGYYHNFALTPLVLIAEAGTRNDLALYEERGGILTRLVDRVVDGLENPAYFERVTGARQDWVGSLNGGSIPWMEPYHARFRDARLVPWLHRLRPIRQRWFGGDATLCYGMKNL